MTWSTSIYSTQTGAPQLDLVPVDGQWGRGDVTARRHKFLLRGNGLTRAQNKDLFTKWDRVLVQKWDGFPTYAGLIINTDWDREKGILTVEHQELRILLSRRWMYGIGGYFPTGQIVCTNLSLRGIVAKIAAIALTAPISGAWPVPVNIETPEVGTVNRTYDYFNFQSTEDAIAEIETMDGGPDTDLQQGISGGSLYWDFRIGTPYLTGPSWDFILDSEVTPTGLHVKEDGSKQSTGVFGVGKGQEADMVVGGAALSVSAGLAKDTLRTWKELDSKPDLDSHAQAVLNSLKGPTTQWSMNVKTDQVSPAEIRIGSTVRVWSEDDEWIGDGWTTNRVIGFSGDYSTTMTLQLEVV